MSTARINNARTDVNTYLSENLSGMKVTQIFNQEQRKMDEFLARSKRLGKTKMNRMFVFGIFRPMVYMLFVTSNLFLFYIRAARVISRNTDLSGANHYQRDGGRFLYVYLPVLQPHSGAGRAV